MRINPINTNNNTNYKALIKPSASLEDGFSLVEKSLSTGTMKDMNSAKDFIDSMVKISETQKIPEFTINIDKRRPDYTYTKINNRRVSGGRNERDMALQDSYRVVEGIKQYASKLEAVKPSALDFIKIQIEETEARLDELKERYYNRLQAELEQAKQLIFKKAE